MAPKKKLSEIKCERRRGPGFESRCGELRWDTLFKMHANRWKTWQASLCCCMTPQKKRTMNISSQHLFSGYGMLDVAHMYHVGFRVLPRLTGLTAWCLFKRLQRVPYDYHHCTHVNICMATIMDHDSDEGFVAPSIRTLNTRPVKVMLCIMVRWNDPAATALLI